MIELIDTMLRTTSFLQCLCMCVAAVTFHACKRRVPNNYRAGAQELGRGYCAMLPFTITHILVLLLLMEVLNQCFCKW